MKHIYIGLIIGVMFACINSIKVLDRYLSPPVYESLQIFTGVVEKLREPRDYRGDWKISIRSENELRTLSMPWVSCCYLSHEVSIDDHVDVKYARRTPISSLKAWELSKNDEIVVSYEQIGSAQKGGGIAFFTIFLRITLFVSIGFALLSFLPETKLFNKAKQPRTP